MPRFEPLFPDDPRAVAGYGLRARLGAGGMGRVYLSFTPGGRAIAIKVVRPEFADDEEFRRRFRQEVQAAQRVQGLYTAPVVDADPDAPLPWLATAYVAGPSLQQAVGEHGAFPQPTAYRLLGGVAEALVTIHGAGLVHRDLKPANVLLADDGPRVIDFGIARAAEATTATRTGARVGTPAYMAPEQVKGQSATPATDVFALGQLMVYAVTGRPAFGEGNVDALFYRIVTELPTLDGCPGEMLELLERCLSKDPGERPEPQEIIEFARAQNEGETLNVAASWLPAPVATQLASYGPAAVPPPAPPPPGAATGAPQWAGPTANDGARNVSGPPAAYRMPPPGSAVPPQRGPATPPPGAGVIPQGPGTPVPLGVGGPGPGTPPPGAGLPPQDRGGPPGSAVPPRGGPPRPMPVGGPNTPPPGGNGPVTPPPGMTTPLPPGGFPPARPKAGRRKLPFIVLGAATAVIVVLVVGIVLGTKLAGNDSPSNSARSSSGASQPSAGSDPSNPAGTPSPEVSVTPTALGFAQEYTDIAFTLPAGTNCSSAGFDTDTVTFTPQGPSVGVTSYGGDLQYACTSSGALMTSTSDVQIALVTAQTDGPGCVTAVTRQPLNGNVPFANMTEGMQLCAVNQSTKQVAYLVLKTKNKNTSALTWTATGWNLPETGN